MGKIAVIDTETNWYDQVMSIGIAVADRETFSLTDTGYYILNPEYQAGGMYDQVMDLVDEKATVCCSRQQAMTSIRRWLEHLEVADIFAYNARFDCHHLPELGFLHWHDIMKIAAYRQYNPCIPGDAPCCSTGRLKRSYGVEPITRMLTGDRNYCETHNALYDAMDELRIMKLLPLTADKYELAKI